MLVLCVAVVKAGFAVVVMVVVMVVVVVVVVVDRVEECSGAIVTAKEKKLFIIEFKILNLIGVYRDKLSIRNHFYQ